MVWHSGYKPDDLITTGSIPVTSNKFLALVSLVVEVLFCKQGVVVRFHPGAPSLWT